MKFKIEEKLSPNDAAKVWFYLYKEDTVLESGWSLHGIYYSETECRMVAATIVSPPVALKTTEFEV